ncbi:hypothetical protein CXB51_033206 [Gossypium anomalum]|uniref:Mitochondrial import inner membrane translocase subunit TIM22 n=1 Tax=Gossypium anomalum TaxID=47600 RepID=A0A8J6CIE0_9ROSI|nr:hypothetical protein CXB51_033206 [Gossypium anomalum]
MAAPNSENELKTEVPSSHEAEQPQIQAIRMPSMEEIRAQEVWNNCAVRSVASGVMGGGLGFMMGMFLGALDNPVMQDQMSGKQQLLYNLKQMGSRSWSSAKTFAVMGVVFSAVECVVEKARAKHDTTNTVVAGCVTGGTMSAKESSKPALKNLSGLPSAFHMKCNPTLGTRAYALPLSNVNLPHLHSLYDFVLFRVSPIYLTSNSSRALLIAGPKAACVGCVGFAAFSVAIEKFFDRHT